MVTWYLSVEMQMTVIAPILIYIANKLNGKFIQFFSLFVLIGIVLRCYAANEIHLDLSELDLRYDLTGKFLQKLYLPTHVRAIPYLTGIIGGYLIFSFENGQKTFNINRTMQFILWIYTIGHLLSPLSIKFLIDQLNHSLTANIIVEVYGRVFWAFSIVWIIVACHCGKGGIINDFLSNTFLIPISKLGLGIYLAHTVIEYNVIISSPPQKNFETIHMVRK